MTELTNIVLESIKNYLGSVNANINLDTLLDEEYNLDSTEMVCIAVDIEKKIGKSLKEVSFSSLKTPRDVINSIKELV